MRLENKVAMITGAAMGIGRATAMRFAQEGADIVILDLDLALAKKAVKEIESLGRRTLAVKADVSHHDEVEKAVKQAIQEFGRIDILVNNAGICPIQSLLPEMTEEQWDSILDVNLKGSFICSKLVSREMIKRKKGKIINISSIASYTTYASQLAYVASKGGVNGLTLGSAIDLAPYHINVNAVAPGSTDTHQLRLIGDVLEKRREKVPLGELNQPEDIAGAVLFLASADADHITGRVIVVDGGEIIHRSYD
jgi:NAD(P)-dependent dehydrogenase (short-subunit alcohol dehydrogenase family)